MDGQSDADDYQGLIDAGTCPGRGAARRLFAAWCAAEPGPRLLAFEKTGVPVLRSGTSRRIAPGTQEFIT